MKTKLVYVLRIRWSDSDSWGQPNYYRSRAARDYDEKMNRLVGGIRTHSYQERKTEAEIEALTE